MLENGSTTPSTRRGPDDREVIGALVFACLLLLSASAYLFCVRAIGDGVVVVLFSVCALFLALAMRAERRVIKMAMRACCVAALGVIAILIFAYGVL